LNVNWRKIAISLIDPGSERYWQSRRNERIMPGMGTGFFISLKHLLLLLSGMVVLFLLVLFLLLRLLRKSK
jgi:hypothetical protein